MPPADAPTQSWLRELSSVPAGARWLGYSGLLPFAFAALMALAGPPQWRDPALYALLAYGAVILSFLGGVRWGLAVAKVERTELFAPLFISIIPSLISWVALLVGGRLGLVLLATSLSVMLVADLRLTSAPRWYRALRLPLSAGAVASLLLGALA